MSCSIQTPNIIFNIEKISRTYKIVYIFIGDIEEEIKKILNNIFSFMVKWFFKIINISAIGNNLIIKLPATIQSENGRLILFIFVGPNVPQ